MGHESSKLNKRSTIPLEEWLQIEAAKWRDGDFLNPEGHISSKPKKRSTASFKDLMPIMEAERKKPGKSQVTPVDSISAAESDANMNEQTIKLMPGCPKADFTTQVILHC